MTDRFCACGLRLSIADAGNTCIHCQADNWKPPLAPLAIPAAYDALGRRLCKCGRLPVMYHGRCRFCNIEQATAWRKQKQRRSAPELRA